LTHPFLCYYDCFFDNSSLLCIYICIDAFEMILCGAAAVQVGTCHWTEGPKCFNRICNELIEIMKSKGYNSIDDFKGQLKEWSREGATKIREAKKKNRAQIESASTSGKAQAGGVQSEYQFLSMLLTVVVAILIADKYGVISI
jgi:dihydroorotate dehydrogenase (fumarate)